ncbi:MAG TPA: ABC transporter permease [Vicinamibacterales bacterium]|nr:ABC transporter permease [Vicinamibacterales bacterium]
MTDAPVRQGRRRLAFGPELAQGFDNLRAHKLRSALTMLGMIFGVAAVIAMLSIGAGAQQQMIAFIQQLGVRNVIVEARESTDSTALSKVRKLSAGLSFRDVRMIEASLQGIKAVTARKRFTPAKLLPKPYGDVPVVYGVSPVYQDIASLGLASGRFFTEEEAEGAASVAVLGQAAAAGFFGSEDPVGRFVKVNDTWYRIVGVVRPQLAMQGDTGGLPAQDQNNLIYVPLKSAIMRIEDSRSYYKDEIDGIYIGMSSDEQVAPAGVLVRGLLDSTHNNAGDFSIIVPAELLAQQERTKRLFEFVMVAIASISLLVGGIGIMNIMLASVMERTREIGVRRAVGARKVDVVRQFLIETTLITVSGGAAGTVVGIGLSRMVAYFAGWSTIVTVASVVIATAVSVTVGIVFGLYPAVRAARLNPVSALHYE